MAGCFGSHPIDRWMERKIDRYLDSQELPEPCRNCELVDDCECTPDGCRTGALTPPPEPDYEAMLLRRQAI